jgi:hypothetical protein
MKDRNDLIKEIIQTLDKAQEQYVVLSSEETDNTTAWLEQAFPIATWGQILWPQVTQKSCHTWQNKWQDLPQILTKICDTHDLHNPEVIIVWTNALKPALRMSLDAVRRHTRSIVEMDFDTWMICPREGWCIEVYHEGEICFGKVLSQDRNLI